MNYAEFLTRKVQFDTTYGNVVDPDDVNPVLLPHQRDIVTWAVRGGRRAIFASFGLGKSVSSTNYWRPPTLSKADARRDIRG